MPTPWPRRPADVMRVSRSPGPRSRIQRAPARRRLRRRRPSRPVDEDGPARARAPGRRRDHNGWPNTMMSTASASAGGGSRSRPRATRRQARRLRHHGSWHRVHGPRRLRSARSAAGPVRAEPAGRQHDATTPVADRQDGGALSRLALGQLGDDDGQPLGVDVGDGQHRRAVGTGDDSAATADETRSGTDELGGCEQRAVRGTAAGDGSGGDQALRVADGGDRGVHAGSRPCCCSARSAASLGEEDAGQRDRGRRQGSLGRSRGRGLVVGESCSRIHAIGSKPTGRTTRRSCATGSSIAAASFTSSVSVGSRPLSRVSSASALSHGAPCPPERERVRLAGTQTVHEGSLRRGADRSPISTELALLLRGSSVSCSVVDRH